MTSSSTAHGKVVRLKRGSSRPGATEYDVKINARTGKVVSRKVDD